MRKQENPPKKGRCKLTALFAVAGSLVAPFAFAAAADGTFIVSGDPNAAALAAGDHYGHSSAGALAARSCAWDVSAAGALSARLCAWRVSDGGSLYSTKCRGLVISFK